MSLLELVERRHGIGASQNAAQVILPPQHDEDFDEGRQRGLAGLFKPLIGRQGDHRAGRQLGLGQIGVEARLADALSEHFADVQNIHNDII